MAELLLIVSLLAVFVFGFYLMSRLDRFLEENRKALLKENESCEPSKVLLPHGLSESEILCAIRRFRETHGNVDIILSDGKEDEYGAYLWILKPEMAAAFRELEEAEVSAENSVREALASDISSFGTEGNLFSSTADETVEKIRKVLEERSRFFRKSLSEKAECCVCGIRRLSLLKAVPYGEGGMKHKGLVLCPIHAALFAAHLISFSDRGKVLVSPSVTEEEKEQFGLTKGMDARYTFSRRRMAVHRRIFNQKGRKEK